MRKLAVLLIVGILVLGAPPVSALSPTGKSYGDVALAGGYRAGHFEDVWDLTACDLTLSFTYDGNGLLDDYGSSAHARAELGVRTVGYPDFNPTSGTEGAGVWLATDYDYGVNTFDPDPPGASILDKDDKLVLQKAGGSGEGAYNLPSIPANAAANHRFWFDRDGVSQTEAQNPLAVDGATYNTGGRYQVVIRLHAVTATSGTAYLTVNGLNQGFETDGNWETMELSPAGMTFTGHLDQMQVFYGLSGYPSSRLHRVAFKDISVVGCPYGWIEVTVQIKGGSTINLKSKGVVPAAVLSTDDFDAATIDPATVSLAGAAAVHWAMEDVDADGDTDLRLQFRTQELNLDETSTTATLTGETVDGKRIRGTSSVRIVPGGK
jgi:hypothetical protein